MVNYSSEHKSPEQLIRDLETLQVAPDSHIPAAISAQIQVKLVGKLCDTIDGARENFSQQSTALETSIAGARQDFIKMTGESIRKVDDLKNSIDDFRKSNERTSNALVRLTWVLVFAAGVQAFYAIMLLLKG
jgi:hypothetical protein